MRHARSIALATAFGLILLTDERRLPQRYRPQYLVDDATPAAQIRLLPKAHWRVHRGVRETPKKPRHLV